jgi:hypothetical protein
MIREAERKINEVISQKVFNSLQTIEKEVKESTQTNVSSLRRL